MCYVDKKCNNRVLFFFGDKFGRKQNGGVTSVNPFGQSQSERRWHTASLLALKADVVMLGSLKPLVSVLFMLADVHSNKNPMFIGKIASCAQRAPGVAESETSLGSLSQHS